MVTLSSNMREAGKIFKDKSDELDELELDEVDDDVELDDELDELELDELEICS